MWLFIGGLALGIVIGVVGGIAVALSGTGFNP